MFLTKYELATLTAYVRPSAQIRWLQKNNFKFFIGADGRPKMLREQLDEHLNIKKVRKHFREPNFKAFAEINKGD